MVTRFLLNIGVGKNLGRMCVTKNGVDAYRDKPKGYIKREEVELI